MATPHVPHGDLLPVSETRGYELRSRHPAKRKVGLLTADCRLSKVEADLCKGDSRFDTDAVSQYRTERAFVCTIIISADA